MSRSAWFNQWWNKTSRSDWFNSMIDQIAHQTIILIDCRYIIEHDKCDIDIKWLRNGNFNCCHEFFSIII